MRFSQPRLSRSRTGIFNPERRRRRCDVNRRPIRIHSFAGILVVLALTMLPACQPNESLSANISIAEIGSSAVTLKFSSDRPISGLRILDSIGRTILSQQLSAVKKGELILPLGGDHGEITVVLLSVHGKSFEKKFRLNSARANVIGIRSPFQSVDDTETPLLVTPSSTAPLILSIDSETVPAEHYRVNLRSDGPLLISTDGAQWAKRLSIEEAPGSNALQRHRNLYLKVSRDIEPAEYRLMGEIVLADAGGKNDIRFEKKVAVVGEGELSEQIGIDGVVMPTSRDGKENGGLRSDQLALSGGGRRNANGSDDAAATGLRYPLSYQTVNARNRLGYPVAVVLTAQVLDSDRRPAASFQVPPSLPGPLVQVAAILPARGTAKVTLPIYGDRSSAEPGEYIRKIELVLAGTDIVLDRVEAGLTVERPAELAMMVTLIAAGLAVLAVGLVLMRGDKLHAGFTTRQTVLTGLFAAASVVLVNVPAYFLTSVTVVVLGPLGFLVDGLLSEFVFFALLAALVSIVPRQGVCATVTGVRFLLGGMLLGMVTPVGILYATVSALALELSLWISRWGRGRKDRLPMRSVLLFALANAFISWAGFQFSIVLFRLHYAHWYIALSVLVGGFAYALLGSLVGRRIGARLARAVP